MEQQEQKVVINLNDVATVVQLIDVVSQRGAFRGDELAGVGALRNKLEAFVRQNAPQQAPAGNDPVNVAVPPAGPLADKVVN